MFLQYYGLREQPFGVTPDPRFLYMGAAHQEAYSSLLYGIETGRGFMALIAPPGLGKTTVLFRLLESLREFARTMFLFQTNISSEQVIRNLIADLGTEPCSYDLGDLQRQFGDLLFRETESGKRVVVAIDEAQNLDDPVLEMIRMLSNYESRQAKLLQIVMAGQPQLASRLASPKLEQLRQRLAIVTRCLPFDAEDIPKYIHHRLVVAGYKGGSIFTPDALQLVVTHSKGIPRSINNLCFQALSLGCANNQKIIEAETVQQVIADLSLESLGTSPSEPPEKKGSPADGTGSVTKGPSGRNISPNPSPSRFMPEVQEVGASETAADDSSEYAWAKNQNTADDQEIPAAHEIPPPAGQPRRTLLFVLFGLLAFLVGVWAGPWIKVGFRPLKWRAGERRTSHQDRPMAPPAPAAMNRPDVGTGSQNSGPATLPKPDIQTDPNMVPAPATAPAAGGAPSSATATNEAHSPPPPRGTSDVDGGAPREADETLAGTGHLSVLSDISGARVSIDGRSDAGWKTPHVFSLKPGTYAVSVSRADGAAWTTTVQVEAGKNRWITAELADRDPALLTVDTVPPGMQVVIDGKAYGPSRVDAVLAAGPHEIQVLLGPGLPPFTEKFRLTPGEALTKRFTVRRRTASPNPAKESRTPVRTTGPSGSS